MAYILVVDDEEKMQHLLSIMLVRQGYNVDRAGDGRKALEMKIDGSFADSATARIRHGCLSQSTNERTKNKDRGSHLFHDLVGCNMVTNACCVNLQTILVYPPCLNTKKSEKSNHGVHITKPGDIADCVDTFL